MGHEILSLKCSVPSCVVPLLPAVWRKIFVVYSVESSGQRVDSPNGPRFGPTAIQGEGTPLPAHPGTAAATRSFERKALPGSTEASMNVGGADLLLGNGNDSDNNANDFYLRTTTTRDPQNRFSPTE